MLQPIDSFNGDFDWLPLASQLRYGAIPFTVSSDDFQSASVRITGDLERYPEAHWYLEAMQERRWNPGRPFDDDTLACIAQRVSKRLYERTRK